MTSIAPPAITPDVRMSDSTTPSHTAIHIKGAAAAAAGKGNNVPASAKSNNAHSSSTNSVEMRTTAMNEYSSYRSAPANFPAYDRLRFVKLPKKYLPDTTAATTATTSTANCNERQQLHHWPALIYPTLAELVRDLPPSTNKLFKAQLILEHRRNHNVVCARLVGWRGVATGGGNSSSRHGSNNNNTTAGGDASDDEQYFVKESLQIVRLSGSSIQDNEDNHSSELLSFYEGQFELEEVCNEILRRGVASNNGTTGATSSSVGGVSAVVQHALNFRKAFDTALNILALDVGSDPIMLRGDPVLSHVVQSSTAATVAGKEMAESSAKKLVATSNTTTASKSSPPVARLPSAIKLKRTEGDRNSERRVTIAADRDVTMEEKNSNSKEKVKSSKKKGLAVSKNAGNRQHRGKSCNVKSKSHPVKKSSSKKSSTLRAESKPTSSTTTNNNRPTTTTSSKPLPHPADIPWKTIWNLMVKHGWTWKSGGGLVDYYYLKPGISKLTEATLGVDYFQNVNDVHKIAQECFGWGTLGLEEMEVRIAVSRHNGYVPLDAGASEQLMSEERVVLTPDADAPPMKEGESILPSEPWKSVWQKLRKSGWSWKGGSGLMTDYYYIKPGCKVKNGVKGVDYFVKVEDVQAYAKKNYGWVGDGNGLVAVENKSNEAAVKEEVQTKKRHKVANKKYLLEESAAKPTKSKASKMNQQVEVLKFASVRDEEVDDADTESSADDEDETEEEEGDESGETMGVAPTNDLESVCATSSNIFHVANGHRAVRVHNGADIPKPQSKRLFIEECSDENVPPLNVRINPNESWRSAWEKMLQSGWTWKEGKGLMMDYYFIKPGCKISTGVDKKDYFSDRKTLECFMRRNYGWNGASEALDADADEGGRRKRRALPDDENAATQLLQMKRPKVEKEKNRSVTNAGNLKSSEMVEAMPEEPPAEHFATEQEVIEFVERSGDDEENLESVGEEKVEDAGDESVVTKDATKAAPSNYPQTPQDCKTKPQDPAIPLLSSPELFSDEEEVDFYSWENLWPTLQTAGWNVIRAGKYNKLHDWYYTRPNRDPKDENTKLGQHYFTSPSDVIAFVRRLDEENDRKEGKPMRKSIGVMLGAFEKEQEAEDEAKGL
eukprot:g14998.t1 g14998   contig21:322255-325611(+)